MTGSILKKYLKIFIPPLFLAVLYLSFPLQVSADGGAPNVAYVAGTSQGISSIDIGQQKVTSSINTAGDPHTILLSIDGRLLYVTQPASGRIAVIAAKTKQTLCTAHLAGQPTLLTLDPGTNMLYAAGNQASTVSAIDPTTCAIKYTLKTNGFVYGLAVAVVGAGISGGNGNQLWVADTTSLTVFDANGKHLASIPMQDGPEYISIPAGTTAYVTTRQGSVEAVDLNTKQVLATLLHGGTFGPMDYDAITGEVYVPDMQHNLLAVLSPISSGMTSLPREPGRVIRLANSPQSIAITSDGQLGFVALNNGNVVMLDVPGRQVVNTISVGGTPHFIVTGLYPSLISLTPQQASLLDILNNVIHYAAAILIVVVPLLFIVISRLRLRRKQANSEKEGKQK